MNTEERIRKMSFINNGFLHLVINLAFLALSIWGTIRVGMLADAANSDALIGLTVAMGCVLTVVYIMHCCGFMVIQPNQCRVLTFFGKYVGTVSDNGFYWVNPLYAKKKLSLRARNMDVQPIKVNDRNGNPIMIGQVLVWRIKDTYKACFNIDVDAPATAAQASDNKQALKGYDSFVNVQSDAALRKVAGMYAYDNMDSAHAGELTLRSGGEEINDRLEEELRHHLDIAGIEVVEARINYLAYAQEIASVMLKRQQAEAIIAAREKIVDGAVSMVDMALKKLAAEHVVEMDDERKAAMVSNLMVVLCGDEGASPVVNTGSIY